MQGPIKITGSQFDFARKLRMIAVGALPWKSEIANQETHGMRAQSFLLKMTRGAANTSPEALRAKGKLKETRNRIWMQQLPFAH